MPVSDQQHTVGTDPERSLSIADKPPIGVPLNNMMRLGMDLVKQNKLGDPTGHGVIISQSDIASMGQAVHAIPDYNYDPAERLKGLGVDLDEDQQQVLLSRLLSRLGDKLIAADVAEMISTRGSSVSYENWVTSDSELVTLLDSYRCGGEAQEKAARQKLLHIFLTVSQGSAVQLLNRLSTPRKGDLVSDRFNSVFSPSVKADLLSALRIER